MKKIKVLNTSWDWCRNQVLEELKNDNELDASVTAFCIQKGIDLYTVVDLYRDGLLLGIENSEYISFSDWFQLWVERSTEEL